jgi:hypothetical protein
MKIDEHWVKEVLESGNIEQAIYKTILLDERFTCTCDESYREDKISQAKGHYHHCMLYQVSRAIELTLKLYLINPNKTSTNTL